MRVPLCLLGLKAVVSALIRLALPCKTLKEHCLGTAKRIAVSLREALLE